MALFDVIQDIDSNVNITCHKCDSLEDCRKLISNNNQNLKILTFNIRSYNRNFDEFCLALNRLDSNIDVIVLTECWLREGSILEPLPGYAMYRSHSQLNKNGGVIIYTKTDINVKVLDSVILESDSIILILDNKIAVIGIYRSPSTPNITNFLTSLDSTLSQLKQYQTITLAGDLNIDIINTTSPNSSEYLCLMASHSLLPAITAQTRTDTCLDHIFIKSKYNSVGLVAKCSITDHDIALAVLSQAHKDRNLYTKHRLVTKTDDNAINEELSKTDWCDILESNCPDKAANMLTTIITSIIHKHTHKVKVSKSRFTLKPWVTPGLLRCIKHRDKLHQIMKSDPEDDLKKLIYTRYRNFCNGLLHKLKTEYNSQLINKNQKDPKKLWNTLKSIYSPDKNKTKTGDQLILNAMDPVRSLNICNAYFTNVGTKLSDSILTRISETQESLARKYKTLHPYSLSQNSFFLHPTDEEEVFKFMYQLKIDSAPGIDGITTKFLLKHKNSILTPLTHIFNLSLQTGTFPECWKIASVRPIHKNGPEDTPENYRPIALLPIMSKILEKIVNNRLVNYFEKHNLNSDRQFGFRRGKSTVDAATLLTNSVASFTQAGDQTLGLFLDLAKAFDTISINLLLKKLECVGIRGVALDWFTNYLTNRKQMVTIGEYSSELLPISFGIPQGSILGPTLFSFYMNDILNTHIPNSIIISYADDTVILFHDKSWEKVYQLAEEGLLIISEALDINLLTLNIKKTKYVTFYKTVASRPPRQLAIKYHTCYTPLQPPPSHCNCTTIEHTPTIQYLGITLDENLSFKAHIQSLSSKARKLIFIMKKLRDCTPTKTLRTIYLGLCQSVLQYGIAIWGAAAKSTLIEVERAQRAVIKVALRKPFRYPTDLIYKDFEVLRVRHLFILCATLSVHKSLKSRPDYKEIINKRVLHIPLPDANNLLVRRCPLYSHIKVYNTINKSCDVKNLNRISCKKKITQWLSELTYEETEEILKH